MIFTFQKNSPKEAFTAIWIALKRIGEKERNYFDEMSPKRLKTKSVTHPASLALCLDQSAKKLPCQILAFADQCIVVQLQVNSNQQSSRALGSDSDFFKVLSKQPTALQLQLCATQHSQGCGQLAQSATTLASGACVLIKAASALEARGLKGFSCKRIQNEPVYIYTIHWLLTRYSLPKVTVYNHEYLDKI